MILTVSRRLRWIDFVLPVNPERVVVGERPAEKRHGQPCATSVQVLIPRPLFWRSGVVAFVYNGWGVPQGRYLFSIYGCVIERNWPRQPAKWLARCLPRSRKGVVDFKHRVAFVGGGGHFPSYFTFQHWDLHYTYCSCDFPFFFARFFSDMVICIHAEKKLKRLTIFFDVKVAARAFVSRPHRDIKLPWRERKGVDSVSQRPSIGQVNLGGYTSASIHSFFVIHPSLRMLGPDSLHRGSGVSVFFDCYEQPLPCQPSRLKGHTP